MNMITNPTSPLLHKRNSIWRRIYTERWAYILLIPALIFLAIFCYKPMYGVTLAFKKYQVRKGILGSPWVGFVNFEKLFISQAFKRSVNNTIIISLLRIVFSFPMPIIFALMINEVQRPRFKKAIQTISYLPHFINWVIMSSIISEILSLERGPVNYLITLFGGKPIYFLTEPNLFRPILIITAIWKGIGWSSIIYLAAIAGINSEMYEAAEIDGASRLQCMRYITIPSIVSVICIQLILTVGGLMNAGFDQVFNLYNPTTYITGDIIDTYAYRVGLTGKMDYPLSTAITLFKNVIGFALVISTNIIVKKLSGGENGIW